MLPFKDYYITRDVSEDNDQIVHSDNCQDLPIVTDRNYLGYFKNIIEALKVASDKYENVIICEKCKTSSNLPDSEIEVMWQI